MDAGGQMSSPTLATMQKFPIDSRTRIYTARLLLTSEFMIRYPADSLDETMLLADERNCLGGHGNVKTR